MRLGVIPTFHGFRQGGTVNRTYYIFCECGWSTHVENPDGPEAVKEGRRLLDEHIAGVLHEGDEA